MEDFSKDFASMRLAHNAVHPVDVLAAYIFVATGGKAVRLGDTDTHYREALAGKSERFNSSVTWQRLQSMCISIAEIRASLLSRN
ncbi:hypothetical protein X735_22570 [Mesorhizobium sp. L2C085B000]|uniref:hypothetical protein n=1 Tax=Mesorhizobium sp. L2C085B000 TaxID=1287117 RepID=UPI0003CFEF61|nr:hypothetical protein [Mesorhizobium sp. L2C085B000]ESZ12409.1 hypothetical protein X735_22570 [Mesorhizobium sp. L2C085B000]